MAKEKFDTEAMATKLQPSFTLGDAGSVEGADALFETYLKEIGSEKTVAEFKQDQQVVSNFVDSATLAFGRVAIAGFKANKDLNDAEVKIPVGSDKLRIVTTRKGEVSDGAGGRKVKFGQTKVSYLVSGGSNTGSMKKIRTQLSEEAAAALAD